MLHSTQTCRSHNHPEFVFELESDALSIHAGVLLRSIEEMVARGEVLKPDESFQFGWTTLHIRKYDADRLTLFEPDMKSFPVKYVPGTNKSILQMMFQLFTLDSFDIPRSWMMIPNMLQTVMVCDRYVTTDPFFMTRNEPIQHTADSGWYMGCMDPEHDHENPENLKCLSLYEASLNRTEIPPWIILPTEAKVFLSRHEKPKVWLGEERFHIQTGSFVDEMLKNQALG